MSAGLIWPKRDREVAEVRADMAEFLRGAREGEIGALEAKVTDAVRHQPIGVVLMALAMALGRAAAERFGPLNARAFALIATAVQIAWREAADKSTKH